MLYIVETFQRKKSLIYKTHSILELRPVTSRKDLQLTFLVVVYVMLYEILYFVAIFAVPHLQYKAKLLSQKMPCDVSVMMMINILL